MYYGVFFKYKYYREISQDALTLTDAIMTHQSCQLTLAFNTISHWVHQMFLAQI